jgi:hypothetical protein
MCGAGRRKDAMRTTLVCAAMLASLTAGAQPKPRSLSDCTFFDQKDKGDTAVEMTLRNACSVPVDCTVSWRVVCAPQSKKRRTEHPSSQKLAVVEGTTSSVEASAAICGDDAFSIDTIEWSCQPNKD